jgi:hypothetical protein
VRARSYFGVPVELRLRARVAKRHAPGEQQCGRCDQKSRLHGHTRFLPRTGGAARLWAGLVPSEESEP